MVWVIKWNDSETTSDDFLVEDLEAIEKATQTPWSIANPLKSISVARAFLAVAMVRAGSTDKEAEAELKKITLKTLKTTFEYRVDEDDGLAEPVDPSARSPRRTSPRSSRGQQGKGSPRQLPENKPSETSFSSSENKSA